MADKKTLFAVSDIHGHLTALKYALEEAGFDRKNPDHLLICCGDYFDRGTENFEVLKFFDLLENKVLLRGNHEDMLFEIFETGRLKPHNFLNGTVETITEFFGKYCLDPATDTIDFSGKTRILDRATDFINETKNYFETENYVFTHGWLPVSKTEKGFKIKENWRNCTTEDWKTARWTKWSEMYTECDRLSDKTIVCGHYPTLFANKFDPARPKDCADIFYGNGVTVIDGGTFTSGRVNVLVIEDNLVI